MIPTHLKSILMRSLPVFGAMALGSAPQVANAIEIRLALMGQAGIEDPKFNVLVNDELIGEGTVVLAAKSGNGEYISGDVDFDPYVQRFIFKTDVVYAGPTRVAVRFLNDYYDEAKGLDANLYIVSVSVDGTNLDLSNVQVQGAEDVPRERMFWRGVLELPWYATATLTYDAGAAPATTDATTAEEAAATQSTASEAAPVEVAPEAEAPAVAAEAEATPVEPEPVAAAAEVCAATGDVTIAYPNGEAVLSAEGRSALDGLVSKGLEGCSVSVSGYSSQGGPADINLAVSQARAAEVEAYLRKNGPEGLALTAEGKGATDQFGAGAENRRVVVSIE